MKKAAVIIGIYFAACLSANAIGFDDEAPVARAYLDELNLKLDVIESQMAQITLAADLAARSLTEGSGFAVRGDESLASELSLRPGAMMGYNGSMGEPGDVILYCLGMLNTYQNQTSEQLLTRQIAEATSLKEQGSVIIGIGSFAQLGHYQLLDEAQGACHLLLNNTAPASDYLLQNDRYPFALPMATILNATLAWTWECELFAACTRLSEVPIVHESFENDTRRERWLRYGSQKFHHDMWLESIPTGTLGGHYLEQLRNLLLDLGTASWKQIAQTASRASNTLIDGDRVFIRAGGRYVPYHIDGQLPSDPDLFISLHHDGSDPNLPAPQTGDFVIAIGNNEPAGSDWWGEPELLRQASRGVAWIINAYNTRPADLEENELLVDLWVPVGDCLVKVHNYDTRIGPADSFAAETVLWLITAQVYSDLVSWQALAR